MNPIWSDSHGALWQGHVLDVLAAMEPESVQCVVTSPPYWGLRAYGTDPVLWGNHNGCDHTLVETTRTFEQGNKRKPSDDGIGGRNRSTDKAVPISMDRIAATCTRCNAIRCELGSEPLHDCAGWATGVKCGQCFICHLVEVFEGVRRVMRPDGVVFCNLGDSYAGSGKGPTGHNGIGDQERRQGFSTSKGARLGSQHGESRHTSGVTPPPGLKAKDLVGIPWRFALAMQANGWWLRGDYIWAKPNPMPESVTDRCTRSHEYIFHFSKASTYYWDAEAIREKAEYGRREWTGRLVSGTENGDGHRSSVGTTKGADPSAGRNKRSVWEVATHAYPEAHFATFPPDLVKPCILAGCPEGGIVCDPFSGSGTTLAVARQLGRVGWGIELNPAYCDMAIKRLRQHVLL